MGGIAIVTGGGSGIGKAIGAGLVRRGGTVVLADLDGDRAEQAAVEITVPGPGKAVGAQVDVADADAVRALVEGVHAEHGKLNLLCNNAGIPIAGEAHEFDVDHWRATLDVNLMGVVHGVSAAYPLMVTQGFGHIVNTASLAGLVPPPMAVIYATSKHAVVGLSLSLRAEAAAHGVKVSCVCPGGVDTRLFERKGPDGLSVPPSAAGTDYRDGVRRAAGPLISPDRLADDVIRGIARNQALIVSPWTARVAWRAYRFAPALLERYFVAFAAKERALRDTR